MEKKPLEVSCFGSFKVIFPESGAEMRWRTQKAKELFAYMIELQGVRKSRSQLTRILWPEELPDHEVARFHNLLYTIRNKLKEHGREQVIIQRDKEYFMDFNYIHADLSDIILFTRAVESKSTEKLEQYAYVLEQYKGRYMDDMDNRWIDNSREYFERVIAEGCCLLAEIQFKREDYHRALTYLLKAWTIDSYSERVLILLFKAFGMTKDLKGLKLYYERYCENIKREFKLAPGPLLEEEFCKNVRRCTY